MKFYSFIYYILIIVCANSLIANEIKYSKIETSVKNLQSSRIIDSSPQRVDSKLKKGSHVKLFLPYLPYLAITHSVNGMLARPANNEKGWEYYLATNIEKIDNKTYDITLKKDVFFQDGTPFNADAVLLNLEYFKKQPARGSGSENLYGLIEKLNDYKVRYHLNYPSGVFYHQIVQTPFYSKKYLDKYGWNGKDSYANLAEPGPYGLGPYILEEGYIEGDRSTPKAVLRANPYYKGKDAAKVEKITIYTSLNLEDAKNSVISTEGELDITPISFSSEVEIILSNYAKLIVSKTTNSYAVHFNLINGSKAIKENKIRYAINQAINKEILLNIAMMGEGSLTPTTISPHFYKMDKILKRLEPFLKKEKEKFKNINKNDYLKKIVTDYQIENNMDSKKPLEIKVLTSESFLFLMKEIKYFLEQININLKIDVVQEENKIFKELLTTYNNKNEKHWDILIWANFDWFKHPYATLFVYYTNIAWSPIPFEDKLHNMINKLFVVDVESDEYISLIANIMKKSYLNNYMLFLPSPNIVYAVNKEVVFHPRPSAFIPLWELEVTDLHWSLRKDKEYPEELKKPYEIIRKNF